ncbi:MAG TPA: Ig-like domain-containing protein, partial [Xanthomonadales bacterium]|nr:Ig-like domain-containing protein [Xanthomonadales bacterium]
TTTTITDLWEQAYDYGVGLRLGRWFDESLWRLTGGLDYEWGDYSSDQFTASVNLRKHFVNSPHSFGLNVEYFDRSGDFEFRDNNDFRGYLIYRYDFGTNSRPTNVTERVEIQPENLTTTRPERRLVRNEISVEDDIFFELDRSEINASASETWSQIAEIINNATIEGDILVVGNTCDLGSVPYNQGLSERRAAAVRDELIRLGVDESRIRSRGDGELNPRYPNDSESNRSRNRRVDIRFLTLQEGYEEVEVEVPVEARFETRTIPVEPNWLRRALRNPAMHKRIVDTYQFQTEQSETVAGDVVFLNGPPVAVNDAITLEEDSANAVIDILVNDSDPDGDSLTVIETTEPQNGTVVNNGTNVVYTPNTGFFGTDTFTYTIGDGSGLTDTATVTVTVTERPNRAPVAVDDFASTVKNTELIIDVLANDSDPDGDPLSVIDVVHTTMGFATIQSDGTILYIPMPGWWGGDTLTYTISDPDGLTATATVTLDVTEE